ncbi:MAG: hypothetical protein ACRETD_07225, partial [Steroidobacteraceae bacterium]
MHTTVTGTAASGKPTAGATVTIKDASGNSATGTTGTDGTFKVTSTTKFSPPLLVQVGAGAGATMYSVSADTNLTTMINVTPLTDLVVRSYYNVQGVTADTAFGALASNPPPAAATVQILGNAVQSTVQLWLNNAGVANAGFNLISTPFNADGTGVDKVLDETTVTTSSNTLKITDGTTTQTSTLAAAATGTVTITTTTTNGATTSTASQSVAVPTSAAQQTDLAKALAGVQTMFTNVIGAAAAKGASFAAADAMAFIDTGYLSQGQNAASFAMTVASFVNTLPAGAKVSVNGFVRTNQFTDTSATNQTLNVTVDLLETLSDGSTVHNYLDNSDDVGTGEVYRLQSDGSWRFYGDQSIAKAHVQVQQSRFYEANNTGAPNTPSNALQLQGQVSVATGTLTTVSLSGPADSLPDCSTVTNGQTPVPLTLMSVVLMKDAGIFNGNQDRYDLPCTAAFGFPVITTAPAAGTPYVF